VALLAALLDTPSRTLPLWLMDVQVAEVRIAARAPRGGAADAEIEYVLALEALARREYRSCAAGLERLKGRLPPHPRLAIVHALALRLAGDRPGAEAATAAACAGSPPVLDAETCGWLAGLSRRALLSGEAAP
jgi:hypothetical protein